MEPVPMKKWACAVWQEKSKTEIGVILRKWIDTEKKVVYWPSGVDVLRAERYNLSPSSHWKQFRLIKMKCEDDDIEVCKLSDLSASEDEHGFVVDNTLTSNETSDIPLIPASAPHKTKLTAFPTPPSSFVPSSSKVSESSQSFREATRSRSRSPVTNRTPQPVACSSSQGFPLETAQFQKAVLNNLGEIAVFMNELRERRAVHNDTKQISALLSLEEFETVEEQLKDENYRKNLVEQLSQIGGVDVKDATSKIIDRMFSVKLQCKMNMKGSGGKLALEKSGLWRVVIDAVKITFPAMKESSMRERVMVKLKNAPGRKDGTKNQ